MNHLPQINNVNARRRRGFTLVETIIAMGIITIMITAFLAAFGPAVQGIRKSISAKEANRLASTLEHEMSVLRAGSSFSTSFEKSYDWIKGSGGTTRNDIVLMYQYRGDVSNANPDGTLTPYTGTDGLPGQDYVVQSVVRRLGDSLVQNELAPKVVEGRVFYVRMHQLIFTGGELGLTDEADFDKIIDPTEDAAGDRDTTTSHTNYPEAVIAFQAEFYVLKSSIFSYANNFSLDDDNNDGHPDALGKPIFTRNMAVRR